MNPAIPGQLAVYAALVLNIIVGVCFFLIARGNRSLLGMAHKAYHFFVGVTAIAVAYLLYLFFSQNYAIKYVFEYSDSTLGFFYRLSSFWAGQEGTYLLWLFLNSLFGYIILKRGGQYKAWAMVVFSGANLFALALMTKLSPYALLSFYAPDGAGLNPLLQDAWMVIHPPVIFVGYSMSAVPFSLAMAALITKDFSSWVKRAFPWVAVTALFLAAGNILGGYWAYKTLGWGGFWAWDPVENSSFIPWFVSLALLHGMILEKRSGALRKTNILLAAFTFILVVYGTFLTRSGVLSDFSVHSFVDLGINNYLVGFLVFYILLTITLFLPRIKAMGHHTFSFNLYSKEFAIFIGMVCLFVFSMIVLFWTSLPILTTVFTDTPRAADLATYNNFALPIAVIFALFLTVSPFVAYQDFRPAKMSGKIAIAVITGVIVGFGLVYLLADAGIAAGLAYAASIAVLIMLMHKSDLRRKLIPSLIALVGTVVICVFLGVDNYLYILYFGMAAMAAVANFVAIFDYLPGRWRSAGGQLSHFGFGLMLIGILGSSAFTESKKIVIPRGDSFDAFNLNISYQGMQNEITYPKNKLLLDITDGGSTYEAHPELYYSEQLDGIMRRPYIRRSLINDLYFSPEQIEEMPNAGSFAIAKGDSKTIGGYTITFNGYEMGSHDDTGEGMSVLAKLTVAAPDGTVSEIAPERVMAASGNSDQLEDRPAFFGPFGEYNVSIIQIQADQGKVGLHVHGMNIDTPPDRLVLDVSRKPLINFVWFGTTLIMLAGIVVFTRRRSEM